MGPECWLWAVYEAAAVISRKTVPVVALPYNCGLCTLACLFPALYTCVGLWQVPEGAGSSFTQLVYVSLHILSLYNIVILKEPVGT